MAASFIRPQAERMILHSGRIYSTDPITYWFKMGRAVTLFQWTRDNPRATQTQTICVYFDSPRWQCFPSHWLDRGVGGGLQWTGSKTKFIYDIWAKMKQALKLGRVRLYTLSHAHLLPSFLWILFDCVCFCLSSHTRMGHVWHIKCNKSFPKTDRRLLYHPEQVNLGETAYRLRAAQVAADLRRISSHVSYFSLLWASFAAKQAQFAFFNGICIF